MKTHSITRSVSVLGSVESPSHAFARSSALLLLLTLSATLSAQTAAPHTITNRNSSALQGTRGVSPPSRRFALSQVVEKRLAPLTKDELKPDTESLARKAGVHRKLEADLGRFGRWDITPEGKHLWRFAIQSPEAAGLRFHIRGFHVGAGLLWLHDGSGRGSEIMGPYSGEGPFGDGKFWTDVVLSDTAVLEFQTEVPPRSAAEPPPFEILEISHLMPEALETGKERQAAANCHLDATCYQEWAFTARSVGHITFEKKGGSYVCSGTLLATQRPSGIPYFLTADHCIPDDAVARTMQVFWMYQTTTCNGDPPGNKLNLARSLGARYLAGGGLGSGDFTLVQLTSVPDTVVFSGWDTAEPGIGASVAGIHHPDGDYKRISFGRREPAMPGLPGTDPDYYYSVAYTEGRTQGGSSGSGLFARPGVLVGTLTWGQKQEGPNGVCQYHPYHTGYGRFSTHYPHLRQYLEGSGPGGNPPPPAQPDTELTSGRALQVSLPPATTPALYNRYLIRVPEGATSLEVSLRVNAEVGVAVSAGEPPKVVDGRVSGDYFSSGTTGQETVVVNGASTPALRPGVYYIGLANFTLNQAAAGTLTATVVTGGQPNPPAGAGRLLTPGAAATFSYGPVRTPTLMNGEQGFRIEAPPGATRLEIRLATSTADADLDLYARFGSDVELRDSGLVADHISDSPAGTETIIITPQSSPALRAGTYFIGLGVFAQNIATEGSVTAIITRDERTQPAPPASGNALTSGVPRQFNVAPVSSATLLNGAQGFTIQVPRGATRLDIRLNADPATTDIDLYARLARDIGLNSGTVEADYDSSGPDGSELISITAQSNPPLKPGTYFIAFGVFTTNAQASATVTATVTGGDAMPPAGGRALISGTPATFFTNPQPREVLLNGIWSYTIQVPQGATRLEIKLNTRPADFDMDVFARAGADPVVENGRIVADHGSTGPDGIESIVITASSTPPLKPGTYYVALGVCTKDRPASGTLTATVETGGGTAANALRSGVPADFSFAPVERPALEHGQNGFYIDVAEGATRLDVRLNTATAGADLDLYVRRGQDVIVVNGGVVADFRSEGPAGSEAVTVTSATTPPLQPGRYYVGIAIYTTGVPVSGTVTATFMNVPDRPSGSVPLELRPETPASIILPGASTQYLYTGPNSYKLTVPEGASGLKLELRTETPGADVDLYVRHQGGVELRDGRVIADYAAVGQTGDETLTIDRKSSPPLRPGVYYVALANLTPNTEVRSTLTMTVGNSPVPPQSAARVLEPDTAARFELPAAGSPSLFQGEQAFRIWAPPGTGKLVIRLRSDDAADAMELSVRYGQEATVELGRVISDYAASVENGEKEIVINNPKAGIYFINLKTTGAAGRGTLTASLSNAGAVAGGTKTIRQAPSAVVDDSEPVFAKPAANTMLTLNAEAKSQEHRAASLSRPALSKGPRIKKLIPLTSLEP